MPEYGARWASVTAAGAVDTGGRDSFTTAGDAHPLNVPRRATTPPSLPSLSTSLTTKSSRPGSLSGRSPAARKTPSAAARAGETVALGRVDHVRSDETEAGGEVGAMGWAAVAKSTRTSAPRLVSCLVERRGMNDYTRRVPVSHAFSLGSFARVVSPHSLPGASTSAGTTLGSAITHFFPARSASSAATAARSSALKLSRSISSASTSSFALPSYTAASYFSGNSTLAMVRRRLSRR